MKGRGGKENGLYSRDSSSFFHASSCFSDVSKADGLNSRDAWLMKESADRDAEMEATRAVRTHSTMLSRR